MGREIQLYPAEKVRCPDCGGVLGLFTQGDGFSLHTCNRSRGSEGSCGQQMMVIGASGGCAVAMTVSKEEAERMRSLERQDQSPSLRRYLDELGAFGPGASQKQHPPPLGA